MENLTNYISHHTWILTAMFIIVILAFIFMIIYTIVTISKNTKKRKEFISEMKVGDEEPKNKFGQALPKFYDTFKEEDININIGDILNHKKYGKIKVIDKYRNLIEIQHIDKPELQPEIIIFDPDNYNWTSQAEIIQKPKSRERNIIYQPERTGRGRPKKGIKYHIPQKIQMQPEIQIETPIQFEIGDTLKHKIFGPGELLEIQDDKLIIKFADKIRKIAYKPEYFI